jgi:hypothetical protein
MKQALLGTVLALTIASWSPGTLQPEKEPSSGSGAGGATNSTPKQVSKSAAKPVVKTKPNVSLKVEGELATGSRNAIIETGMSESYFNAHFRLVNVFDRPGDQRVVWRLLVNGYETNINDAIGFYTEPSGKRVYVHSIKDILGRTRDIVKTISKTKSVALMKSCLGNYTAASVVLIKLSPGETASLFLTAHSRSRPRPRDNDRDRERHSEAAPNKQNPQVDQPENEGNDRHPPARIGYVNLETGKCSKGLALVTP